MKATFVLNAILVVFLIGCTQSSNNSETVSRPETSDESTKEILNKHDQSVGVKAVRELKSSVKKDGGKVTPTIEANISTMITEAKDYQSQVSQQADKLSKEDFELFERNTKRLLEKETQFETLKQSN